MRQLIEFLPDLGNSELGPVLDQCLMGEGEGGGLVLTADSWLALRGRLQVAASPLHWWEVPTSA